jgi:acyl dehydratase
MSNKFRIGDVIEEEFSFSQEQVNRFAELTGDDNPIHHDPEFASNTVFKKPIIHGFLSSSIFSKILGISMPGKGTIYLKQEMNFRKAMYVGETYTCIVEIRDIAGSKYTLDTKILNDKKEPVVEGYAIVLNNEA